MSWERATPRQGLSGRPWRRLREQVLARDKFLCVACAERGHVTPAAEVDHIVPLSKQGTDHPDNLASLCADCHAAKTATDCGRTVRPTIGADGYPVGGSR